MVGLQQRRCKRGVSVQTAYRHKRAFVRFFLVPGGVPPGAERRCLSTWFQFRRPIATQARVRSLFVVPGGVPPEAAGETDCTDRHDKDELVDARARRVVL